MSENKAYLKFVELMQNKEFEDKLLGIKEVNEFLKLKEEYDFNVTKEDILRYYDSLGVKKITENDIDLISGGKKYESVPSFIHRGRRTYICPICNIKEAEMRVLETKTDNCKDEYELYRCVLKPNEHLFRRYTKSRQWKDD